MAAALQIPPLRNTAQAYAQYDAILEEPGSPFLDPITQEVLKNSVITQCGHTFSAESISAITAATPEGRPVLCPMDRSEIDPADLPRNLFVDDAKDFLKNLVVTNHQMRAEMMRMQADVRAYVAEVFGKELKILQDEISDLKKMNAQVTRQRDNLINMGPVDHLFAGIQSAIGGRSYAEGISNHGLPHQSRIEGRR